MPHGTKNAFKVWNRIVKTKRATCPILNIYRAMLSFDDKTGSTNLKLGAVTNFWLENSFLALVFKFDQLFVKYSRKWCHVVVGKVK